MIIIIQESLNANLEALAAEGLFDPVLTSIASLPLEKRNSAIEGTDGRLSGVRDGEQLIVASEKSVSASQAAEVVIHVVDDVREAQRDFHCSAKVLLEKMPYFVKATQGIESWAGLFNMGKKA